MMRFKFVISIMLATAVLFAADGLRASAQESSTVESVLIDAVSCYNNGDFDSAIKMLQPIVASSKATDAVYYYLGLCKTAKGEYEEAINYMREASRLDTANFWYSDRLARLYAGTSQPEAAIEIYEKLLRDNPSNTEICYSLVNLYARQNKPEKLLATLDEIETVTGKTESVTLTKYDVLMHQNKPEEAYKVLEQFNSEYVSPQILSAMGDHNLSNYDDTLALKFYQEALSYEPECAPALLGATEIYRYRRNYPEFFESLTTLVESEASPLDSKTQYISSILQHSDERWLQTFRPQLDTLMQNFRSIAPKDSMVLRTIGSYYYNTGRDDEAVSIFKEGCDIYPQSLSSRALYVEVLARQEKWEQMAAAAEKAFADFPDEPSFLQMKLSAEYSLEDYDGLIRDCGRLIEAAPKDTSVVLSAYSSLGDIYYKTGEIQKAYSVYDKALKIDPEYLPVLNNYAYFLCLEKRKLRKAYAMSKITVEKEPDNATYLDTFGWILYIQGKYLEAKPFFKHAMLYGGKESAAVLDHYAEVLFALKEYDLAKVYWNLAKGKNTDGSIPDLDERVQSRLDSIK